MIKIVLSSIMPHLPGWLPLLMPDLQNIGAYGFPFDTLTQAI
jgi:hypothetical protein